MNEFEKELLQSLKEVEAIMDGAPLGVHHYPKPDPREVRERAGLSQAQMAPLMGMSVAEYEAWEGGRRSLSGPSLVLFRVLDKHPEAVLDALAETEAG